jgi:hypothetical protein
MTGAQTPVSLNELLDRPLILSFKAALALLNFITQCSILLWCGACLTLELTRAERRRSTQRNQSTMKAMLSRRRVE